jgi:hypothetical protein
VWRFKHWLAAGLISLAGSAAAEEYRGIFWNLESGDSDASLIASQMVAKGPDIDFWGLSEVENQATLNKLEQALEAAHGVDYVAKLSEEGGGDRLAILYQSDRMTAVPYSGSAAVDDIGDAFFEVDSINVGGTLRPGLGVQLQSSDGQMVIVLVNHWKCCGGTSNEERREKQAIQMNAFAIDTSGIPIIAGGDFNIPINAGGQLTAAFMELSQIWEYKEPQPGVGTYQSGSVLDAVFVANRVAGWDSTATILERDGNTAATTSTFSDNASQTDHRPLLLVVSSDKEDRLDSLREAIADMEAALNRLKVELARLEGMN